MRGMFFDLYRFECGNRFIELLVVDIKLVYIFFFFWFIINVIDIMVLYIIVLLLVVIRIEMLV